MAVEAGGVSVTREGGHPLIEAHHLKTAHIMSDANKTSCKIEDNKGGMLDLSPRFFISQHTRDFNDLKQQIVTDFHLPKYSACPVKFHL